MFSVFEWKRTEIAVVAGIIGFITLISWYQIILGGMKTRDAQRKSDVEMVARGLWRYYSDYKVFPAEATGEGKIAACGYKGIQTCEWNTGTVVDELGVVYINKLPDDPLSAKGYKYVYKQGPNRQSFRIYVALENKSDKDYKRNLTQGCGSNVQCSWYVE